MECNSCKLGPCKPNAKRCDGLSEDLVALSSGSTSDWYNNSLVNANGQVRIEAAASREFYLKGKLDDQVQYENSFPEDPNLVTERGLPPCKRVKGSNWLL